MTRAHSDEPYVSRITGKIHGKLRFFELEHESKMRLLETHSQTSERQGNGVGKVNIRMQGRPSLKGQETCVKENHRHVTRDGEGRGRCMEKRKVIIKNEKKNNPEYICQEQHRKPSLQP